GNYTTLGGNFSELNFRNSSGADTIVGNDMEISGTGLADLNAPAAASGSITMGNLKIGDGQILGVNKNNMTVIFPTVTLTGGNATLSVNPPNFVAAGPATLTLGSISENTANAGIIKDGTSALNLIGTNTYTGGTTVALGTLALIGDTALTN